MARVASFIPLLLVGLSVESTLVEEAEYMGCFSPSEEALKVEESLSLSQCLNSCDVRIMTYAAVQVQEKDSTLNICYCLDTLEKSSEMSSSLCGACLDVPNQFCGSSTSLSVYKLSENQPLTLLLATDEGLHVWKGNNSDLLLSKPVKSVDFHYSTGEIFFIAENRAYKSFFYADLMRFAVPEEFKKDGSTLTGVYQVLVDREHSKCYFIYLRDCCFRFIQTTFLGKKETEFTLVDGQLECTTADFHSRMIFYVTDNKLYSQSLVSGERKTFRAGTENVTNILKIVANAGRREIYIVGKKDGDYGYCLIKFDYNDKNRRVLYEGSKFYDVETVDIYENHMVWVMSFYMGRILYTCKLCPRCLNENIKKLDTLQKKVNDLKIYHPQITVYKDSCEELKCSHICTKLSHLRAECNCPAPLVLGSDNRTCHEEARSLNNVTYLGCYMERIIYRVSHSLSWEESLHFCDNRKTIYAAIQADSSALSYNFPFCSNDLIENQEAVNSSLCGKCEENSDRFCGGNNTMSVYKLRESSPLRILLATDYGLRVYSEETKSVTDIEVEFAPITAIDFYLPEDKLFFTSTIILWRTYYSPYSQSYVPAKWISPVTGKGSVAVDWVNRNLYFSSNNNIYKSDLKGDVFGSLVELADSPEELVIDPYNGLIFCVLRDVLHSIEIKTTNIKPYENEHFNLARVLKISVDSNKEIIYMIGEEKQHHFRLLQTDYLGEKWRVLYKGEELKTPSALSVWGRQAIWVSAQDGLFTLHSCTLTPRCLEVNLRTLANSTKTIFAIKIYSVDVQNQTRAPVHVCGNAGCFHGNSSKSTPESSSVDQSKRDDSYKGVTVSLENTLVVKSLSPNSNSSPIHDDQLLKNVSLITKLWEKDSSQKDPKVLQFHNTGLVDDRNVDSKSKKTYVSFFYAFMVVLGLLIVIIILNGVYFILKLLKPKGHLGPTNKPASEIELTNTISLE